MPSIGELFVELGVVGDVKPLEKAIGTMKEAVKQIDNEIKANQRLLKYLQDIKNARNASEKALIKQNFAKEIQKQKMLDEIDSNQKAVDGKKELASKIAGVVKGVGLFVGALTGAAVALNNLTNSLVESNQAMLDLTRTTDIAQSTFQKWGGIGKMLGVENADQQLASLNQRLFDLMLTGEGARGFQLAGINPMGQDAEGVLEQLRARVSRMNDTTATYLLQQMGLDPKMLYLLRMSRSEFEALGRTIKKYQLSPEQTKQIQALNIQLQIAGIKLKYLKDKAIMAIMPAWTQFMHSLARVTEGLETAVKWVTDFISKSPGLQSALKGVAAAMAIILAITKPLWAAFVGLYLIIDDVVGYFQGKNSVLGAIINGLEDLDLKGFIDFPVPEWLEKLIKVIDFLNGSASERAAELLMDETVKKIDPDAVKVKNPDGSYGYAEIPPGYGVLTGGAAPLLGYTGELPNLDNMFVTPAMQRNLSYSTNNTSNTDNRQINQNISIQSSQPVFDIQNQLAFARNAITSGW